MAMNLASFPNSRINPTPATQLAVQTQFVVPAMAGPALILPANVNRTYDTLYNTGSQTVRIMNWDGTGSAPSLASILANGFPLIAGAAYEVDTPEAIYVLSTNSSPGTLNTDQGSG